MREVLLLLLVLGTVQVNAKEIKKKLNLTPPGQKAQTTEDPGSATRLLYEDPRNKNSLTAGVTEEKASNVAVKSTCTDSMGMIHKQDDQGYAGCMRTLDKTGPKLPGDDKRPSSVGITIGK